MRAAVGGATEVLLERDRELEQIERLIELTLNGAGGMVMIEGAAGLGKTRLLSWTRSVAARRGLLTLGARGGSIERELAFGVARQLFEGPLRRASADDRRQAFAGAAGLAESVITGTGFGSRDTIFPSLHGLFWLCVNLADRTPLLVMVDDAHWADEASLLWLSYLARRLEDVRALVVVARRPAQPFSPSPLLDSLAAEPGVQVVPLRALSAHATAEVARLSVEGGASSRFAAICHARTGGNPFLLHELLAALAAEEIDPATDAGLARVQALRPRAVSRTVLARLGALPSACRALASVVAVLGAEVELRHAAALAGIDPADATSAIAVLAATEILSPGDPLEFAHPLVRDAIYEDLSAVRRAELHRGAARLLHDDGAGAERVAAHLLSAQRVGDEWAVAQLREAARVAASQGVHAQAVRYLERALVEPPPTHQRAVLLGFVWVVRGHEKGSVSVMPPQQR